MFVCNGKCSDDCCCAVEIEHAVTACRAVLLLYLLVVLVLVRVRKCEASSRKFDAITRLTFFVVISIAGLPSCTSVHSERMSHFTSIPQLFRPMRSGA